MKGTIDQLQIDIKNALAEMDAATLLLSSVEKDFLQTQLRHSNGLITYAEVLNKQDRLYRAQSNLVQSEYNYYFKQKNLMLYHE